MAESITITSPVSGEQRIAGNTYNITWTGGNPVTYPEVQIQLYKGAVLIGGIYTTNDGSYSFTIPAGQAFGDDYRHKITEIIL